MLRCAAFFVVATYVKIRLTPQDLRALPLRIAVPVGVFYEAGV
jgi:hypothetical protein